MSTPTTHSGIWTNPNAAFPQTLLLTIPFTAAAIILVLLGLFVNYVSNRVFVLLAYALVLASERRARKAWHTPARIILRNTEGSLSAAWPLFRLALSWRKHKDRPLWPLLGLSGLALLIVAAFAAAAIGSSFTASDVRANAVVLIDPQNCGLWLPPAGESGAMAEAALLRGVTTTVEARSYAAACYNASLSSSVCETHVVPEIPFVLETGQPCPFWNQSVCFDGTAAPVTVRSLPMDSSAVLGIKAPAQDRVTYQKAATCGVVTIHKWGTSVPGYKQASSIYQFQLGTFFGSSITYAYDTHSLLDYIGYNLVVVATQTGLWTPIADFMPLGGSTGDVSLFFLNQNVVSYTYAVEDPWYQATSNTSGRYDTDFVVNTIGCVDQGQFCNPSNQVCTNLTSQHSLSQELSKIGFNPTQQATAERIWLSDYANTMWASVEGLGSNALLAQAALFGFSNLGSLPDNQWQKEVSLWFWTSLARLQFNTVRWVSKDISSRPDPSYSLAPLDSDQSALCYRQLVKNTSAYRNFNVFGLLMTLIVGILLIVLSFCIEATCCWCCARRPRMTTWLAYENQQLMCAIFAPLGVQWTKRLSAYPWTADELTSLVTEGPISGIDEVEIGEEVAMEDYGQVGAGIRREEEVGREDYEQAGWETRREEEVAMEDYEQAGWETRREEEVAMGDYEQADAGIRRGEEVVSEDYGQVGAAIGRGEEGGFELLPLVEAQTWEVDLGDDRDGLPQEHHG